MTKPPSIEEFAALQMALDAAQSQRDAVQAERDAAQAQRDSLVGQNRLLRVQRDLLQEKLNKLMRKVFAASSEVLRTHQKDMFFNEAEALAAATKAAPAQQDGGDDSDGAEVAGHKRAKRGRKPLDPALPRHIVRHELSDAERRLCA